MRENSLRNIPLPDHGSMDGFFPTELARADSDSESSAITVESLHLDGNSTPAQSAEWTNEKHNAYLDFLETSFVQQLHGSTGLGRCSSHERIRRPFSSRTASVKPHSSSGRLMVLRDGTWHEIKCERNEPMYDDDAVSSHGVSENPWIRHFTSVGKHRASASFPPQEDDFLCDKRLFLRKDTNVSCEPAGTSQHQPDGHHNAVEITTEVSDQNFVDEDQVDKSSFTPVAKRLRLAASEASRDDQVVPVEKCQTPNISTVIEHPQSKRKGQPRVIFRTS